MHTCCPHDSPKCASRLQNGCHLVRCRGCSCLGRLALERRCLLRLWPQKQRPLSSMSLHPLWRPSTGEKATAHSTTAQLAQTLTATMSSAAPCVLQLLTGVMATGCPQLPCCIETIAGLNVVEPPCTTQPVGVSFACTSRQRNLRSQFDVGPQTGPMTYAYLQGVEWV